MHIHSLRALSAGAVLHLLHLAVSLPHGDDHGLMGMGVDMQSDKTAHSMPSAAGGTAAANDADHGPMSYFVFDKHASAIIAHIVLMVLAWFFILPVGTYHPALARRKKKETVKAWVYIHKGYTLIRAFI